jgi:hypothetical protein
MLFVAEEATNVTLVSGGNIILNHADTALQLNHTSQGVSLVLLGSIWHEITRWGLQDKRTPVFGSGWSDGAVAVRYWKDSNGYVQMEGLAQHAGSPIADSTICTLTPGYEASASALYLPAVNANGFVSATIRVVGNAVKILTYGGGSGPIIDLSTVRFRQES